MTGLFALHQPDYAALGISVVPCSTSEKKSLVTNWQKMGRPATTALVHKFPETNAFGFVAGRRSGITVVDVDVPDECAANDAIDRYGEPRVIVTTATGKFHLYYLHNGERRWIRPYGKE